MLDHSQSCAGFQRRYAYTCVGCQAYREVSNAVHIPGVSGLTWAETTNQPSHISDMNVFHRITSPLLPYSSRFAIISNTVILCATHESVNNTAARLTRAIGRQIDKVQQMTAFSS